MIELEEWRARPTRENRLTLGSALAELPRPLTEVDSEIVLEWAIGLPVVGGSVLWTAEPNNAALAFAIRGGHSTRRGLPWFAFEAFQTARRIGRGRAIDRTIRVLLLESMNETDPCFWAAVALALRFPRYTRFHGWPIRVQRPISREPSGAELRSLLEDDLRELDEELTGAEPLTPEDRSDLEAMRSRTVARLVSVSDSDKPGTVLENLVEAYHGELDHWDEDELFVPCEACQKAQDPTLCETCRTRRAAVQARNAEGRAALVEPTPAESVWRRFPEILGELSKDRDGAAQVVRSKLAEFKLEGGVWAERDDHRAVRPPQKF